MKTIKRILKSIAVAFSIYSLIPMPKFDWASEDMDYHLIFFPWIGVVIGAIDYLWVMLAEYLGLSDITRVLIAIAIPLFITGGFHVDGFMDTCDALKSYGDRDKKLEILKDPHIGAFSVICLVIYMLLIIAGITEVDDKNVILALAVVPSLSRAVSGLIVTLMNPAKKDGMLRTSADNNARKTVAPILIVELIILAVIIFITDKVFGITVLAAEALFFLYFKRMADRQFGGVTGDLAGFYVCLAECVAVIAAAICCVIM